MPLALSMFAFFLLSMIAPSAYGAKVHGVEMPDSIAVETKTLKLNGIGVRTKTFLGIKVYVAGLYLEVPSKNAEQIVAADRVRRLRIQLTHNAPNGKLVEELRGGTERNVKDASPLRARLDRLLSGVPSLKEGQTLTITYVPGKGTSLVGTGGREVTAPGKDLADALFSAWLGKEPLDDALKEHLLGAK